MIKSAAIAQPPREGCKPKSLTFEAKKCWKLNFQAMIKSAALSKGPGGLKPTSLGKITSEGKWEKRFYSVTLLLQAFSNRNPRFFQRSEKLKP